MNGYYHVLTDGKTFRIAVRSYGSDDKFVSNFATGKAIEFANKEDAEAYIHDSLSMGRWRDA